MRLLRRWHVENLELHVRLHRCPQQGDTACTNRRNIRQDQLEATVLAALESELMKPELLAIFCKEYVAHQSSAWRAEW
jgi:hypothetical protein